MSPPSFDLPGFVFSEELHRGRSTVILRGIRTVDSTPVVVKTLKEGGEASTDALRLRHEFEIMSCIKSPHVVKAEGLERHKNRYAIVLNDSGGTSLSDFLSTTRLDTQGFLEIAVQLAIALRDIHAAHVIHKDFNPSNIVIQPDTRHVEVIDFGIASLLTSELVTSLNPSTLEGTLPYISPEQTGRMNRSVDYRTDLYSLGVTLYEALIGWPPFQSQDPMELLHCHIARVPDAPHDLNSGIQGTLSDIIMKLLAKTAEERYQNAGGLLDDLQRCLDQWRSLGRIGDFPVGESDVSDRLLVPQQLYGREEECAALLVAFDRVCNGNSEFVIVSGEAGIGKSALVHEVHKPIVRNRGYFISGKFDQFNRDIPFASLTQAFRGLVDQVLSSGSQELEDLRSRLQEMLGPKSRVLSIVIPEIELIVGEQPPVQELPPSEAQNRFNAAMLAFVRVLARKQHPLVMFLDDLQWADQASLSLIQQFMADPDLRFFLLIGAYRDVELHPAHPLAMTLDEMQAAGVRTLRIPLRELACESVQHFIQDALHVTSEDCDDLADIVARKTGGNPYFVIEFLMTLYQDSLLRFDGQRKAWIWDITEIQQRNITENVVSLMAGKIQRLSQSTQRGLISAACVGNSFELDTLATVLRKSRSSMADDLWPAVREGLVLPMGEGYKFVHEVENLQSNEPASTPDEDGRIWYRFSHDRVQQAAYALISATEAKALHREIGRCLYRSAGRGGEEDRLFDIVNQFNLGSDGTDNEQERLDMLHLNLRAGKRAKSSAAFAPALHYFSKGAALLTDSDWDFHHEAARDLLMEKGECEHLTGAFRDADQTLDDALARFHTSVEKGRAYALKIDLYVHQSFLDKALETGLEALKILGFALSPHPGKLQVLREMAIARWRVKGSPIADLVNLPPMTNEEAKVAIDILMRLFGIAYSLSQEMSALVVSKMMNLTLRYGNADVSSYVYGIYGLLVSAGFGAYRSGYALAKLGLDVSEKSQNRLLRGRCNFVVGCLHNHWHYHASTNAEYLSAGYRDAMESGDLLYASYCLSQQSILALTTGLPLEVVYRKASDYLDFVRGIRHEDIAYYFVLVRQVALNLQGLTAGPSSLSSDGFEEEAFVRALDATQFTSPRMFYRVLMLQLCYLHGRYEDALKVFEDSRGLRHAMIGQLVEAEFNLYHSLTLAQLASSASVRLRRRYLKSIAVNQRAMRRWADHCPQNFLHKFHLVAAEQARLEGRYQQAEEWYDMAIREAAEQEYVHLEALGNELAAALYVTVGREKVARTYLTDARKGYERWGATGKVEELERTYPRLLADWIEGKQGTRETAHRSVTTTTRTSMPALELVSVLKASQALSGEIVLEQLLTRMMSIVLENAGAQRGFFIMGQDDQFIIRAGLESAERVVLETEPLEGTSQVSEAIVRYVARTRESVILHDAAEEGRYLNDPYVLRARPKSVLCMPVVRQGNMTGVLYLENNLSSYAFTPARLEVLRLLSSQIAVSLENARLYGQERELARFQEQLRLASTIQRELLPKTSPHMTGYDIGGINLPAQMVGGDYFDFIRMDEQRLALCIGDVSGKGFPASLLMANLQASLRGQAVLSSSPGECISKSNRLLYESTGPEKFATVFYGVLDAARHRLTYTNAGHEYPLLIGPGGEIRELHQGGIALGMLEEFPFVEDGAAFQPGDTLVMYSDGITEAMNEEGEQFGRSRLDHVTLANRMLPIADLMTSIVEAVHAHVGEAPQSDDITLVVVRRCG